MSFSFRDRPRLSERLRGKSGDEILNEIKEQFDQDRKMFFDSAPSFGSTPMTGPFSRTGFPFEDDMMSRGRQDIRSHLDDLAQRHPEFADHLRCPPWAGEMGGSRTWGQKRRGSGSGDNDARSQASGASSSSSEPTVPDGAEHQERQEEPGPLRGRSRQGNLPQFGLRNTVDLGQQQHECEQDKQSRGQRSMSAPPDNRSQQPQQPQRYVSRIEINPVNPADPTSGGGPGTVTSESHGKPPAIPKQPQQATPTKQAHAGNVRHIPIFVEGRDEPLLPKNVHPENTEQVFTSRASQPGVEQVFPPQQSPHSYSWSPQFTSQNQFYPQKQQMQQPQGSRNFQQPTSPKQQWQTNPQAMPQQQKAPPPPPPSPQQQQQQQQQQQLPSKPPDAPAMCNPISRVQAVQKDVDELRNQVGNYSGNSRKDKEYIFLDEMLTRNLLKLDDIDTEGKEDVRQARKDAIQAIQRCISVLEGKVPLLKAGQEPLSEETAMDIGSEVCQSSETGESVTEEMNPIAAVMEVAPTEGFLEKTVAEVEKVSQADTATSFVSEQIQEGNVEESGSMKPHEEQEMDIAQTGVSTEVKPDVTGGEISEQVPMEVDNQKESSEKSQPVATAVEPKKLKKCGKKSHTVLKKDSAQTGKTNQSTGADASNTSQENAVTENADSKVETAEVTLPPQTECQKAS